ncbi:FG-GAP and VCBS repeat-containing protein [Streptomyces sp. 11x1]|uniref:FG-GAP and VCBS repeat-containing protein n=1 Tax=Streptomyces sp. 11x1 TaxID=3038642 RepID=UPI002931A99D|nr:FG-GAP and VCBS repeat-containing protein [Streptomyces sp. 11x1]WNZ09091.1 FG-GAP and VCBS repeat-containing protein [Streptomyces sp. 11x1]
MFTRRNTRLVLATAAAVSLTGGLLGLSTGTASAAPAKYADDFNGDGYRDYATTDWGSFTVTYGTATGPGTKTKTFTQNSAGVPGKSGDAGGYGDGFGEDLAAADLNRDGYADLAVADRSEKVSGKVSAGAVTIMWGAKSGLGTKATRLPLKAKSHLSFGNELETGDFDGDGKADLAVADGIDTVHIYRGGFTKTGKTGKVTRHTRSNHARTLEPTGLVAGKVTRDKATDLYVLGQGYRKNKMTQDAWLLRGGKTVRWSDKLVAINNTEPDYDPTGVIADFDKDGYGDLAVGDTSYNKGAGSVVVVRGGKSDPTTKYRLTQATSGVATAATKSDGFGYELSAGDTNRDGYADLAVGVPGEKIGSAKDAGGFHILRGGRKGLSGTGSQWFSRTTAGVPGNPEEYGMFGSAIRLRDLDGDGDKDLLAGSVNRATSLHFRAGASGITSDIVTELSLTPTFPQ